jgi:hypothetical protein
MLFGKRSKAQRGDAKTQRNAEKTRENQRNQRTLENAFAHSRMSDPSQTP